MKQISKIVKSYKHLVFLDFEGTQYSHEIIAIGATVASIKSNGQIKKYYSSFKRYVKAKNPIGNFVTNLTGITEEKLKKDGVRFSVMLEDFKKYLGRKFKSSLFVTFGNYDYKMFAQTCSYNLDTPKKIAEQIKMHMFDFLEFISSFIRDDKHNPYSLSNYCKLYGFDFEGTMHDPECDAINLGKLYEAFIKNKPFLAEEYEKFLSTTNHLPTPVRLILGKLKNKEDVKYEDYHKFIEEFIDDQLP